MLGDFWRCLYNQTLLHKFSMMLIKIKMDLSPMLNISNSSKNTFVSLNHVLINYIIEFEGKPEPPKPVAKPAQDLGPERFSRLRKWIW